jgi:protoporphyrinogen oxidase
MELDIVILGAGPAGLGAGYRAAQGGGDRSWRIFEATGSVGGLSASRRDENGFTWDLGGHVIFSKDKLFNSVVDSALGDDALTHDRFAFIRMMERFIPFPLQNNIHRLPKDAMEECLAGMVEASSRNGDGGETDGARNFYEWIEARLGRGLAKHFMWPYNRKVWDFPIEEMGYGWIDERVSLPDIDKVRRAVETGEDETGWGGNATFRFPRRGGTGGLFEKIAEPFADSILFGHEAVKVDPIDRVVTFGNGERARYKKLITTVPLDRLIKEQIVSPPAETLMRAEELKSNAGWMVGIGIGRKIEEKRCWVYFPENNGPFYRVTYFSNYSPENLPDSRSQSSFLCEISVGPGGDYPEEIVIEETLRGLIGTGLLEPSDRELVVSTWKERLPYSYPIPTIGRDAALTVIQKYLKSAGIYSVGRFGGWRYEEGNMDHSFLAGVEAMKEIEEEL